MTNLGSILKSKDITLLTKVHVINSMAFSVVVYGCEIVALEKTFESPMDNKEIKPVNPKGNQP